MFISQLIHFSLVGGLFFFSPAGYAELSKKEDRDLLKMKISQKNYPGAADEEPLRLQDRDRIANPNSKKAVSKKANSTTEHESNEESDE